MSVVRRGPLSVAATARTATWPAVLLEAGWSDRDAAPSWLLLFWQGFAVFCVLLSLAMIATLFFVPGAPVLVYLAAPVMLWPPAGLALWLARRYRSVPLSADVDGLRTPRGVIPWRAVRSVSLDFGTTIVSLDGSILKRMWFAYRPLPRRLEHVFVRVTGEDPIQAAVVGPARG